MEPSIQSISSVSSHLRQDVFPTDQWTITTRKGIILQSRCTCKRDKQSQDELPECNMCKYYRQLPQLHNMPDMLFDQNVLKLEHFTGVGIEFNALDALRLTKETKDPLQVAAADGWQSARADFPFAKKVIKPFDWTFTTDYRGTLLSDLGKSSQRLGSVGQPISQSSSQQSCDSIRTDRGLSHSSDQGNGRLFVVEETEERIDVNKLKVREEILFYDDVTLYEDELADHGTAQYSVKVRVMPKSMFILARFYLRIDGVLARINDTRIYHELNKKYLLREYTNREAKLAPLNLPVPTLVNPNELMNHLPIIHSSYQKLHLPRLDPKSKK